jgi:preprotein translocase subunit SecD
MTDLEAELRDALADAAGLVTTSPDPWGRYTRRRGGRRPHRRLTLAISIAGIAAATAGIVIGAVALASSGSGSRQTAVANGRTVILAPRHQLSAAALSQSATTLELRLKGLGFPDSRVRPSGTSLVAQVPASAVTALAAAAQTPGILRFRQILSASAFSRGTSNTAPPTTTASVGPRLAESPTLTPAFMRTYSNWDCTKQPNPTNGNDLATDYIIGCDRGEQLKYILAPAALNGRDVSSASVGLDSTSRHWVVNLNFTGHGSGAWFDLTKKTFEVTHSGDSGLNSGCAPPKGCNAIAITLDGVVASAPATQQDGIPGGRTQISGNFDQSSATQLANVLKYGSLPLKFTVMK